MAERTLSQRELNRALLARQNLIERGTGSIPAALERMGGLQAQYAPAMYIGLWSRLAGVTRDDVTAALTSRKAIQATLLRSTIHLVSKRDYWPYALGIREARRAWYLRVTRVSETGVAASAERLREAFGDGPLRESSTRALRQADVDKLIDPAHKLGVGLWLDLVRVPPSGTWERRRADLYLPAEQWIGPPPAGLTQDDAIDVLVRRRLGGYGPATRAEIADWAGLPVAAVVQSLERLNVRRYRAEDGSVLLDLPRAPLPAGDTPVPVRFLAVWDAVLLVHARRTGVLPEEYRPRIFSTKTPHSFNTFLVDGMVAGTWRVEDGRLRLDEFAPLDRAVRRQLEAEGEGLLTLHR